MNALSALSADCLSTAGSMMRVWCVVFFFSLSEQRSGRDKAARYNEGERLLRLAGLIAAWNTGLLFGSFPLSEYVHV